MGMVEIRNIFGLIVLGTRLLYYTTLYKGFNPILNLHVIHIPPYNQQVYTSCTSAYVKLALFEKYQPLWNKSTKLRFVNYWSHSIYCPQTQINFRISSHLACQSLRSEAWLILCLQSLF